MCSIYSYRLSSMSCRFAIFAYSLFAAKVVLALAATALRTGILVHGFHLDAAAWVSYVESLAAYYLQLTN
jgi:hypothetical protein